MVQQLAHLILQDTRRDWWDRRFTRLLLDAIPGDCRTLVEYGCGQARAAFSLLPALPDASYLGLESDPSLVRAADLALGQSRLARRANIQLIDGEGLPVADDSTEVVLELMTLQHCRDVPRLLTQFSRSLCSGGRIVAVEPDNLGQRFYFDDVLTEITRRMHDICLKARVAMQPADLAIGPRLPSMMQSAGFHSITVRGHTISSNRHEDAKSFFTRMQRILAATAQLAMLDEDDPDVAACHEAVRRMLFADMPKRLGHSAHIVPLFVVIGLKP